jgi:glycosyltransferase involved in cell wall biosynthesis
MRILIVGKYPPIEGGVSRRVHETARALAERGHEIHVITNASEVEAGFRECLIPEGEADGEMRDPVPRIRVYNVQPISERAYIPWAIPYASKLFGLGFRIARDVKPDLIVGWYFEPYGLVAAQIAQALSIPYVVCHAGSDIGRLSQHPDLKCAYSWMLQGASSVLTSGRSPSVRNTFRDLAVSEDRLIELPIARIEPMFSRPRGTGHLQIERYRKEMPDWICQLGLPSDLVKHVLDSNERPVDWNLPTVATYGKVGVVKGSFDLIEALASVAKKGLKFNFVTAAGGRPDMLRRYYNDITAHPPLLSRTVFLPLIAPWHVPDLIISSHIVCFLERDFPIEFHAPRVPREVLAMGVCLVCSREIARKQPFWDSLVDTKNFVEVVDPKDIDEVSRRLEVLLNDRLACKVIGKHGSYLSSTCERFFHPHPAAAAIEQIAKSMTAR